MISDTSSIIQLPSLRVASCGSTSNLLYISAPMLENLVLPENITYNINIKQSTLLPKSNLLALLGSLATLTNSTLTCSIGSTNLARLTDEEKAIATDKG